MYIDSMNKSEFTAFIKTAIAEAINEEKRELRLLLPKDDQEYCTILKVTERFKVTKATVHNWAKKDIIKKYRINGRTLYKISEIEHGFN